MDQRLTIISLGVTDLNVSSEFYESNFGWKRASSSNDDIRFYQLNGILFSLYPANKLAEDAGISINSASGYRPLTIAYNAHSEEEVNAIIADLRIKGVKIVKEPQKVFWGGYSSYVADPDGFLWEIAFNPFLPMDEKGNVLKHE